MTPHQAYRRTAQSGWTRIEMLLAIYDATIAALDHGIDALNRGATDEYPSLRLRASQLCLLILSGLDTNEDGVARHIHDLCLFSLDQIAQQDAKAWTDARNILATVREGFQEIREKGIQMEAEGTITQLPTGTERTLLHV